MKNVTKLILSCLILMAFTNCTIDGKFWKSGSGTIVEQVRNVSGFKAIEAGSAVEINFSLGDSEKVVVLTDDNLQEDVITEVSGNTLKIYTVHHISGFHKLKVIVMAKNIESIELSGASRLYANKSQIFGTLKLGLSGASHLEMDVKAIEINSEISGASDLILSGAVGDFKVDASGASKCESFNLVTSHADVSASGASKILVTCNEKLQVEASGASNIKYRGDAKVYKTEVSGASSVSKE